MRDKFCEAAVWIGTVIALMGGVWIVVAERLAWESPAQRLVVLGSGIFQLGGGVFLVVLAIGVNWLLKGDD